MRSVIFAYTEIKGEHFTLLNQTLMLPFVSFHKKCIHPGYLIHLKSHVLATTYMLRQRRAILYLKKLTIFSKMRYWLCNIPAEFSIL